MQGEFHAVWEDCVPVFTFWAMNPNFKSLFQSYPDKKTCTKLLTVEVFNKKNIDDKR